MAVFNVASFGNLVATMSFASDEEYDRCIGEVKVINYAIDNGRCCDYWQSFEGSKERNKCLAEAYAVCAEVMAKLSV